jgi:hypothetical protein
MSVRLVEALCTCGSPAERFGFGEKIAHPFERLGEFELCGPQARRNRARVGAEQRRNLKRIPFELGHDEHRGLSSVSSSSSAGHATLVGGLRVRRILPRVGNPLRSTTSWSVFARCLCAAGAMTGEAARIPSTQVLTEERLRNSGGRPQRRFLRYVIDRSPTPRRRACSMKGKSLVVHLL